MSEDVYAAVICRGLMPGVPGCGWVGLTSSQYLCQLKDADRTWRCPQCGADADFDDAHFERLHLE